MNLLITGDFYLSDDCLGKNLFDSSVTTLFAHADYRIANVEAPITIKNKDHRILKTGPHLCANKEIAIPALKSLNIDCVTLANNHIMDYGRPGLLDTLKELKGAAIDTVGAGLNLSEAVKPVILQNNGIRIAILNYAENEWANAAHDRPGANPLDAMENTKQIREAKIVGDIIIVVIHGGHEFFSFPSPLMVKQYRFYAENGASVIVAHHSHCLSGYEVHRGVPIFYGLGNFIFTKTSELRASNTGLLLNLHLERDQAISWDLVPVRRSKSNDSVVLLENEEKEAVIREVEEYRKIIADESLLNQRWQIFLSSRANGYLNVFSPINFVQNKYIQYGLMKLGIDRFFMRKRHYAEILNHLRCEAHAEASKDIIRQFLE